jgi:hypothetical protein
MLSRRERSRRSRTLVLAEGARGAAAGAGARAGLSVLARVREGSLEPQFVTTIHLGLEGTDETSCPCPPGPATGGAGHVATSPDPRLLRQPTRRGKANWK